MRCLFKKLFSLHGKNVSMRLKRAGSLCGVVNESGTGNELRLLLEIVLTHGVDLCNCSLNRLEYNN